MNPALLLLLGALGIASLPVLSPASGGAHDGGAGSVMVAADSTDTFGDSITLDRRTAVDVGTVVASTDRHGTPVLVEGSIIDVCTRKGCWLVVTDGTTRMRVTFKDYGFFVPKDAAGGKVLLQGIVTRQEISEEDARHYAEESTIGEKPEDINGPQQVVTMVASGVAISR